MIKVRTVGDLKAALANMPDDLPLSLRVFDQRYYGPNEFPYPAQFYVTKVRLHYLDDKTADTVMIHYPADLRTEFDGYGPEEVP